MKVTLLFGMILSIGLLAGCAAQAAATDQNNASTTQTTSAPMQHHDYKGELK